MKMSKPFHFQQFKVFHDRVGHKIGTDSLILGAWIGQELKIIPQNILDIGTGSGVLALMMAQHYPKTQIDAVEIDAQAYDQAKDNFSINTLGKNIKAHHSSLQKYEPQAAYDLIISNPPFFKSTSKAAEENRQNARSQDQLTITELFENASKLAHDKTIIATVFPKDLEGEVLRNAEQHSWYPKQILYTYSDDRDPNRFFTIWVKTKLGLTEKSMQVRINGQYSDEYKSLTKDFHDRIL